MYKTLVFVLMASALPGVAQTQPVTVRFKAVVGAEDFACGHTYQGVSVSRTTIKPIDFRLYVHNVRVLDETGKATPLQLKQDDKWQFDDLALLDFEDATGGCGNGTPETNTEVVGTVPAGHRYSGLQFTVGVPFEKNHTDLTTMPSPLNLTAMAWVWNAGRKFLRVEFASTGKPRGYFIHLGSTGCTPNQTKITVPTSCLNPNRVEVSLPGFDPATDRVAIDLAALVKDSDLDGKPEKTSGGCMSSPTDAECAPVFAALGLALTGSEPTHAQTVFRTTGPVTAAAGK
jgi:uncharacterized repeat protein (TIGR04052 family)